MYFTFAVKNMCQRNRSFYCKVKVLVGARAASARHVLKNDQFWEEKNDFGNFPAKCERSVKQVSAFPLKNARILKRYSRGTPNS